MPIDTMREKLDYLVRKTGRKESEIVAQAVDEGVSRLYRKQISDAYLSGELDRRKAILELGENSVDELDYARRAVEADIRWGLESA
jgi:predicted DNA-binding protein